VGQGARPSLPSGDVTLASILEKQSPCHDTPGPGRLATSRKLDDLPCNPFSPGRQDRTHARLDAPQPLVNLTPGTTARRREGMPPQSSDHRQGLHVTSRGRLALALLLATAVPPACAGFDFTTVVHRAERLAAHRVQEPPN